MEAMEEYHAMHIDGGIISYIKAPKITEEERKKRLESLEGTLRAITAYEHSITMKK